MDGTKREIEITYMGTEIVPVVSSFQDEVMHRLLSFMKEHAVARDMVKAYPWEEHFTKVTDPVDLDEKIILDSKKAACDGGGAAAVAGGGVGGAGGGGGAGVGGGDTHALQARITFHNWSSGQKLTIADITDELDGDVLRNLDPYIKIEAMTFAQLHTKFGSVKARAKIESHLPTVQDAKMTMDQVATEIKTWISLPFQGYLGDEARVDCNVILEAIQKIKEHDVGACKKMTGDWHKLMVDRLALWCRVEVEAKKPSKEALTEKFVGKAAANIYYNNCVASDRDGGFDSKSLEALLPFQFLLTNEEIINFLKLKSKHNMATGSAIAAPPPKKAKKDEVDPHAATWNLFRA